MTAPIQEPTAGRTTSGLGYGQRQLFRRPAPPSEAAVEVAPSWGTASNQTTATNVGDSTTWTDMTLSDIVVSAGQTDIISVTNGMQVDGDGIYLLQLSMRWDSGGGTGTWAQAAFKMMNPSGTLISRFPTAKFDPLTFDDFDYCTAMRFYSRPGAQSGFPRWGLSARQVGGGTTQTPACLLAIAKVAGTPDGIPNFLRV